MSIKKEVYLALAILGTIIPYIIFTPWIIENGINIALLVEELFTNRVSSFFAVDFLITWVVLILFITSSKWRKEYLICIIGNLFIGLSFSLPMYLYLRKRREETF